MVESHILYIVFILCLTYMHNYLCGLSSCVSFHILLNEPLWFLAIAGRIYGSMDMYTQIRNAGT